MYADKSFQNKTLDHAYPVVRGLRKQPVLLFTGRRAWHEIHRIEQTDCHRWLFSERWRSL